MIESDIDAVKRLGPQRQEFEAWLDALNAEHAKRGSPYGDGPLQMTTGISCWIGYFKDAYSPSEALEEDQSYD